MKTNKTVLVITHQGQCPHQVSLNLTNPHFQGLTRFLSQGLLSLFCPSIPKRDLDGFVKNMYCYIAGVFSRYSAPIHWLVHGHMTSSNETVSRQMS